MDRLFRYVPHLFILGEYPFTGLIKDDTEYRIGNGQYLRKKHMEYHCGQTRSPILQIRFGQKRRPHQLYGKRRRGRKMVQVRRQDVRDLKGEKLLELN